MQYKCQSLCSFFFYSTQRYAFFSIYITKKNVVTNMEVVWMANENFKHAMKYVVNLPLLTLEKNSTVYDISILTK